MFMEKYYGQLSNTGVEIISRTSLNSENVRIENKGPWSNNIIGLGNVHVDVRMIHKYIYW